MEFAPEHGDSTRSFWATTVVGNDVRFWHEAAVRVVDRAFRSQG
jgi:hypothetical protein